MLSTADTTRQPPKLPNPMHFEGLGLCFWSGSPVWRCPDRNDWFVSGAIPTGYRARQYLIREYWIVTPTHYAKSVQSYQRAGQVQFTQGGVPLPRNRSDV